MRTTPLASARPPQPCLPVFFCTVSQVVRREDVPEKLIAAGCTLVTEQATFTVDDDAQSAAAAPVAAAPAAAAKS